ncbi:MAG: hypothetical protein AABX66_03360 [Nanoarchaeota archaeon]
MNRESLAKIFEIIAGLLFVTASIFISQMTGAITGIYSPAWNEKIGGLIGSFALVFTALFIWTKWKK